LIEDNSTLSICIHQRRRPGRCQPRLCFPVDDFELQAGFLSNPRDERSTIHCCAARFGRNQPMLGHTVPHQLVGTNAKRIDGPVHRSIAQHAGRTQPFADPDNTGESIDNSKPAAIRRCN
jgi:hypothetical protein